VAVELGRVLFGQLGGLRFQPTPKRIRATVNGDAIVDSSRAVLLWEPRRIVPSYAVPAEDIAAELVPASADGVGRLRSPLDSHGQNSSYSSARRGSKKRRSTTVPTRSGRRVTLTAARDRVTLPRVPALGTVQPGRHATDRPFRHSALAVAAQNARSRIRLL
jgi:hypothetical protein